MMNAYAIYRLPNAEHCTLISQSSEPLRLGSLAELNGCEGFVIAPFSPSSSCPILLMQPDEVQTMAVCKVQTRLGRNLHSFLSTDSTKAKTTYKKDFACFHEQLVDGRFDKLVLSRSITEPLNGDLSPEDVFMRACQLYPHQFVALFSTPQTGIWVMATPEILLDGVNNKWHTMALAGTMPYAEDDIIWSEKNKAEQQYVAKYIRQCLETHRAMEIKEEGPYTVQAANLVHLRSDFSFQLASPSTLGNLLDTLHPTPAICGIPKEAARTFILHHETSPRSYYSGFVGPLNLHRETHLYVSLRCMQLMGDSCTLYAGGGILPESNAESEWRETEAKMATMRRLLQMP